MAETRLRRAPSLPDRARSVTMRTIFASAVATAFILFAGIFAGIVAGAFVNDTLPGHSTDPVNLALSMIAALTAFAAGGAVWGWAMSRITRSADGRRMAWAGAIGFAPTAILVVLALTVSENLIVEQRQGPELPIHNVFTILFVPAAAIISGVGGFAMGIGARNRVAARKLAWVCAVAGGVAFLFVNLTMDALGLRVGAPGAAERATMLATALLGDLAAALVVGGMIGTVLLRGETTLQPRALS
jgi:hypothetical protein